MHLRPLHKTFLLLLDEQRLGAGRVSIAFHLAFQASDRTLTDDEASGVRDAVIAALVDCHGAELRG